MSKKNKIRVHVTFRNSDDQLTCMLSEVYASVNEAKAAIKLDAAYFLKHHNLNPVRGVKQSSRWINPKSEDYYKVTAKDGAICVWQYFVFPV